MHGEVLTPFAAALNAPRWKCTSVEDPAKRPAQRVHLFDVDLVAELVDAPHGIGRDRSEQQNVAGVDTRVDEVNRGAGLDAEHRAPLGDIPVSYTHLTPA